jgi:uncharacterized delta-60 repeat protein
MDTSVSSNRDLVRDVVPLADGSALLFGVSGSSAPGSLAMVAKVTKAGALDPTFGTGGVATFDNGLSGAEYNAGAVAPDGSIYAVGKAGTDSLLVKLTATGATAPGFAPWTGDFSGGGYAQALNDVAVTASGLPVAVGSAQVSTYDNEAVVARWTAAGTLDPGFNAVGWRLIDFSTPAGLASDADGGSALALYDTGQALLVGTAGVDSAHMRVSFARVTAGGQLDTYFNSTGTRLQDIGAIDDFGTAIDLATGTVAVLTEDHVAQTSRIVRFTAVTGALDGSWGTGGTATLDPVTGDEYDYGLARTADGGYTFTGAKAGTTVDTPFLAHVTPAGVLDTTFGTAAGHTDIAYGANSGEPTSLAVLPDGRTIVGGSIFRSGLDWDVDARVFTSTADRTAPVVKFTGPYNGNTATTNSPLSVTGTVTDNMPGTLKVQVNGVPAEVSNGTFFVRVPMTPGTNVFVATATDAAGNVGTATVTFSFVDKQAPKLSGGPGKSQGWMADILRAGIFGTARVDEQARITVSLIGPVPRKGKARGRVKTMVYGTKTLTATRDGIQTLVWNVRLSKKGKAALKKVKVGNTKFTVRLVAVDRAKNAKTINVPYIVRRPKPRVR